MLGNTSATSAKLQVGHPPGAPFFQMMGAFFALLHPAQKSRLDGQFHVRIFQCLCYLFFWTLTLTLTKTP
jgi:hypothetical protein